MNIERMVMTVTIPDFMQHNVIAKATFVIQTNQKRYVDCEVSSVRFVSCMVTYQSFFMIMWVVKNSLNIFNIQ